MRTYILSGALIMAVLGLAGCDEKLSDLTGPTPNLEPTLSSIQREIFDTTDSSGRLACTLCHTSTGRPPAGGLNLTAGSSYASLVGVASLQKPGAVRVVPDDPDNSYLIHKLQGSPDIAGARMPRGNGPFLTDGQMQVIERWIATGAPNN